MRITGHLCLPACLLLLNLPHPASNPPQLLVTYVARDKYGRMDGLCPGQAAGDAPRVCTQLAGT